jgi:predicted lipoprotein with Yx(FWY)xxD motif
VKLDAVGTSTGRRGGRSVGALAVTVVMLLVLGACGDDDEEETTAAQGTQAPTTAAASVTTVASPSTTAAASQATVRTAQNAQFGTILVDSQGRTLYTFDRDTTGTSACTGNCAQIWPPLMAPASGTPVAGSGVAALGTISRDTGTQVTIAGKPLYLYSSDARPGDVTGDGVGGVWHVAKAGPGYTE